MTRIRSSVLSLRRVSPATSSWVRRFLRTSVISPQDDLDSGRHLMTYCRRVICWTDCKPVLSLLAEQGLAARHLVHNSTLLCTLFPQSANVLGNRFRGLPGFELVLLV